MNELLPVYLTCGLILSLTLSAILVFRNLFDPFAPVWLFLIGFFQVYVVQALSYNEWAVSVHGAQMVESANWRAFWAICVFLIAYQFGPGRWVAGRMPRAPVHWSMPALSGVVPVMLTWGFFCSVVMIVSGTTEQTSSGGHLLRQFYFMMLGAGILLMVTGSRRDKPAPPIFWAGVGVTLSFVALWVFQGKRSPPSTSPASKPPGPNGKPSALGPPPTVMILAMPAKAALTTTPFAMSVGLML